MLLNKLIMLTLPNFERLKIFHVVYGNKSILKAAEMLNVTRSAVSQSIKSLEAELGTTLFIRDSKKFLSTPDADQLFKVVKAFVDELNSTLSHIESGQKFPVGHLKIGAPMDFGSDILTKIIGQFRKKFPGVTFELHLAVPIKQLDLLCRGELDLAFIDNGDIHSEKYPVTIQSLMKEEFVLVTSEKLFTDFRLQSLSMDTFAHLPIVDYLNHAPVMQMWIKNHFKKASSKLNVVYSAESVRAILHAISENIGVGIVPRRLLGGEFKKLRVIESNKKFINQMLIARQQGKKASLRETEFMKFYRQESQIFQAN